MARRKKKQESNLPEEYLELIRVKPEDTAKRLASLPYTITPRPEGEKQPKGKLWCSYCAGWKKFGKSKKTPESTYDRCETCNISTEDFYIKTHNGLWGSIKLK